MDSFLDTILDRRESFAVQEDKAARAMQNRIKKIATEAEKKLRELEKFLDESKKFKRTEQAISSAKRQAADLKKVIASVTEDATSTLIDARETAFKRGVMDAKFALETAINESGAELDVSASFNVVSKRAAQEAASRSVLGIKPDNAYNGVQAWTEDKYRNVFVDAILTGEAIDTTSRKLQQIGDINQRAATRIARTNINAAMNEAHKQSIDENDDICDGYIWDSVMDRRTSAICAHLHGRFFAIGEKPPGPPAHPNCRSVLIPHFKNSEVQDFLDNLSRRVRDTKTGKNKVIDSDIAFEDWLKKQPSSASESMTGSPLKDKLWRSGKIPFEDLLSPDLTVRSDEEIVQRALTYDPTDPELKQLAKEFSVQKSTEKKLLQSDKREAAKQRFDQGVVL